MRTTVGRVVAAWVALTGSAGAADVGHVSFAGAAPRHATYGGNLSLWVAAAATGVGLAPGPTGLGALQAGALKADAWFGVGTGGITVEAMDREAALSIGGTLGLRFARSPDGPSYTFLADAAWRGASADHLGLTAVLTGARQPAGQVSYVVSLGNGYSVNGASLWGRGELWVSWRVPAGEARLYPALGAVGEANIARNETVLLLAVRLGSGLLIGQAPPWSRLAAKIES